MDEQQPELRELSPSRVILFIILLCFVCGLLLAVASYSLSREQKAAKEFDQSKQMLIAAKILSPTGSFQILKENGLLCDAYLDPKEKILIAMDEEKEPPKATEAEIKEIATSRIRTLLTDSKGSAYTLEEKGVTLETYLAENKKIGYANLPLKLIYVILPNSPQSQEIKSEDLVKDLSKACAFVFPVSGFGLWAPIYGYLAVAADGVHVIGTTWYEHGETPGLGANITEPWWQSQFFNKLIFQSSGSGKSDLETAPIGIIVVKGKVKDVFGTGPKAMSAVDGMSGATLTGDGVTAAYRNSLSPYRPFLLKIHGLNAKDPDGTKESSP